MIDRTVQRTIVTVAVLAAGFIGGGIVAVNQPDVPSHIIQKCAPNLPDRNSATAPDFEAACGQPPPSTIRGSFLNGRLPASALCPIPSGRLRCDAARAWNAMHQAALSRFHVSLLPLGGLSAYRDYAGQTYLYRICAHAGWCAFPGTSNHGLGIAVDIRTQFMRHIVDVIGRKYGWCKCWSDASWEWWHLTYRPGVFHPRRGPPTLRRGMHDHHTAIRLCQRRLRVHHVHVKVTGRYDRQTRSAVKRLQKAHHQRADAVVGPKTWKLLRR